MLPPFMAAADSGNDPATKVCIRVSRFSDFVYSVALTDPSTGLPLAGGIAGWVFRGSVRSSYDDAQTLLTMQVINRDDTNCLFQFYIPVAQVAAVGSKLKGAVWDAVWVDTAHIQKQFAWGPVTIGEGTTR